MRRKVVLYNPKAVFYTMPLALMAVASGIDPERFRVVIVDGRLEPDPERRLAEECADALLLGVSVLTGRPLADALAMSRAVKRRHPGLPVLWGGWHPSLFPAQCLGDPSVDAVAVGQGEGVFAEVVRRLATGAGVDGLADCPGLWTRTRDGTIATGPARPLADLNTLAPHDYSLFDVERYFSLKGRRQLDYISSQGCPYRCAFCADPAVYNRSWTGVSAPRMLRELLALHQRFRLDEVSLQDELFFVNRTRAEAFIDGLVAAGSPFSWTATLRADQAARMDPSVFARMGRSRCRELLIGVESGSPELLQRISKDIRLDQVFAAAELCAKHGVGARFPFIVGFPGEADGSVWETIAVAKRLRRMHPSFRVNILSYAPYPGSDLYKSLERDASATLPAGLEAWTAFDFVSSRGPWTSRAKHELVENFEFYVHRERPQGGGLTRRAFGRLARWRCDRDEYRFPLDRRLIQWLRPGPVLA
jgi:radical SAM superfamily enzyme YgiQ (UPF0313 family)